MNDTLIERLRAVESSGSCIQTGVTTCWHRNPDGPEAADRIEALEAQLAAIKPPERTVDARLRKAVMLAMQDLQSMGDTEEGVALAYRTLAEAIQ